MLDNRIYSILAASFVIAITSIGLMADMDQTEVAGEKVPLDSHRYQQAFFQKEIALAEKAKDRNSIVAHLRKALSYRPNNRDNIVIEYRIGVELSQRYDPKYPEQKPLLKEALLIYEKIIRDYNHMDYYNIEPVDRSMDSQLMVPGAAIHAACLQRAVNRDSAKARGYTIFAMGCFKQTHEKRMRDWANIPKPIMNAPSPGPFEPSTRDPLKHQLRLKNWQRRQQAVVNGEVMGNPEMARVKAAVRQYGYSFGKLKAEEVPVIMGNIIKMFPGTPMAKVAQEHANRAKKLVEKELFEKLPENLENTQSPPDTAETKAEAESLMGTSAGTATSLGQPARNSSKVSAEVPVAASYRKYYWVFGLIAIAVLAIGIFRYLQKPRQTT